MEKRAFGTALATFLGVALTLALLWWGATARPLRASPDTRYVSWLTGDDTSNDCTNVLTPCATIQHAVDVAQAYDEVLVARGTYTGVNAHGGLRQIVYVSKSLTLRGGYELDFHARYDSVAVLDAEGNGRGVVITGPITVTLDGFEITGGSAEGLGGWYSGGDAGGGLYVYSSTAVISGCEIHDNYASALGFGAGGGLYLAGSSATLLGNTVRDNHASMGGGLYLYESPATLIGNTVQDNDASGQGGGLWIQGSTTTLEDNTIAGNTGGGNGSGGGLAVSHGNVTLIGNEIADNVAANDPGESCRGGGIWMEVTTATLVNNLLQGNVANIGGEGWGGGIYLYASNVTMEGNVILSNTASLSPTAFGGGGGMYVEFSAPLTLTNNLIADNHANTQGSGLWFRGTGWDPGYFTAGRLVHNTIADNRGSGQGVFIGPYTTLAFTNTILSGHTVGITVAAGSTATLEATLWWDNGTSTGGEGAIFTTTNVYGDPLFIDPAAWDYHITGDSAALDAGVDAGVTTDLDGDARPADTGFDIGADEHKITCWARLNDGPIYHTVQTVVDLSTSPDDVVKVAGYCPLVNARGGTVQAIYLSKTLTIRGGYTTTDWVNPDPLVNPTTLNAQGKGRVLVITGTVTPVVEFLELTGGNATGLGGGTESADAGGGAYIHSAMVTISHCLIYSNAASTAGPGQGGGVYLHQAAATLIDNTIVTNAASLSGEGFGGGLYLYDSDDTVLTSNTIRGNFALGTGGGGGAAGASLDGIVGPSQIGGGYGGGMYLDNSDATLIDNDVEGNAAAFIGSGSGGGLYLLNSAAVLTSNRMISNTASLNDGDGEGGGLALMSSAATLVSNTIQGNSGGWSGWGGGLRLDDSPATLISNVIVSNTAATGGGNGYGGGLYLHRSDATLAGNLVAGNVAGSQWVGEGGGIFLEGGAPSLMGNLIVGNLGSVSADGSGGGLYLLGSDATLEANAVVSNTATLDPKAMGLGGGEYIWCSQSFTMTNDLIADNRASTGGSGLWFGCGKWGLTAGHLVHNTIADNRGSGEGAFVGPYTTLAFTNTILAGHTVGITVTAGSTATLEATLWWDNGVSTGGGGAIFTTTNVYGDPLFVAPAGWDYHITSGSAAQDAAVDAGVTTDFDGDSRPTGLAPDLGADELKMYEVFLPLVLRSSP